MVGLHERRCAPDRTPRTRHAAAVAVRRHRTPPIPLALALAFALALALPAPELRAQEADHPGKPVYDRWCAGCHGVDGTGNGPAAGYMLPRPRDFTRARYQIRTTASGELPMDADIRRVIDEGMPGTTMPGWEDQLSRRERDDLVDYIKTFSPFFENLPDPEPLEIGDPPRVSEEALAEGREFYQEIECWQCHGDQGRGDGESAPTQEDDDGFPTRPADLTENWLFNGGGSVEAIYTRLRTGLDGTPMPSFSDLIDAEFMTDEQLWNLAHYVRSLSPEEPPEVRDVVRAALIPEGESLPTSPDDTLWSAATEPAYIPLVGQIIVQPRWFAPTVDGVWVEALHDGEELALRLTWNDPSHSPDPAWLEWQQRVLDVVEPNEADDVEARPRPDAFAVQFPRTLPGGRELPYFLMGDSREPVHLWYWRSARPGETDAPDGDSGYAIEAEASGLDAIEPLAAGDDGAEAGGAGPLTADASWEAGRWRMTLRRPLRTADDGVDTAATEGEIPADADGRTQLAAGRAIPIAFFAWDGSNAEEGTRGSISAWYYLYLDVPTPTSVYTTPVLAMMLTAGLGLVVVVRAQRREERNDDHESNETPRREA
ncbi:MAG: c-type cytochrome [Gemmatimonadota bacterium]